jgi:hypothetical protein
MTVISRDEREGSEQMQQPHPIATAACIILTIAFGLFCLRASAATSVRELAAQHRVARAQVDADRPTSTSTYVTPHLNQAQLASGMQSTTRNKRRPLLVTVFGSRNIMIQSKRDLLSSSWIQTSITALLIVGQRCPA